MSNGDIEKKEIEKKPRISPTQRLQNEIAELKLELEQAKNEYYKAYAEADNLKKRLQSQHDLAMKYRAADLVTDLLSSLDNLERALDEAVPGDPLSVGVKMVYDQLLNSLRNEGVEVIEALGQPFDANKHHAILSEKAKGKQPGIVLEVLQKGYMLKDRVIRAALVKVSE